MIDRKIKLKILAYYESTRCVCDRNKDALHWLCAECRMRFKDTPEGKELERTCDAHTAAGYAYLDMVKRELVKK